MCDNILHPMRLRNLAKEWLLEDVASFDFASGAVGAEECEFTIYMKSPGVLAGIPFANAVFSELSLKPTWLQTEGTQLDPICEVAKVSGSALNLLLAERVVLNVLSRASGIATAASRLAHLLLKAGWHGSVAGSRKTTPGFRMVEKYALAVGGADMHRYDLSSMVMVKDNHITLIGSIKQAVERSRKLCGFTSKIEVECGTLEQALEACQAHCDIVMFDNLKPKEFIEVSKELKTQFPRILIEASGGINEENIVHYASPWTDIISSSSLVQGYSTVDFSMKVSVASKDSNS